MTRREKSMTCVPVVLSQLDDVGKQMFADIMQAMFELGIESAKDDYLDTLRRNEANEADRLQSNV